jgi:hypothetical protein
MRGDACVFCKKQDLPCRDGRRFMGKADDPCEGFELDQGAKNAFLEAYPEIQFIVKEGKIQ